MSDRSETSPVAHAPGSLALTLPARLLTLPARLGSRSRLAGESHGVQLACSLVDQIVHRRFSAIRREYHRRRNAPAIWPKTAPVVSASSPRFTTVQITLTGVLPPDITQTSNRVRSFILKGYL